MVQRLQLARLREGLQPLRRLKLLKNREFDNYWFETGSPSFLVDTLLEQAMPTPRLGDTVASSRMLSAFDVDRIGVEALLFQSGYLTVTGKESNEWGLPAPAVGDIGSFAGDCIR